MLINTADISDQNRSEKKTQLSHDSLARQIAQLGSEIRNHELSADLSRIKFVNAVSTHKYLAANYEREWQAKVQRTGNLNYPQIARQKHFSGKLIMAVGINFDGSLYSIRIQRSSGYPSLDDAAKRIVRISAPFAPLPDSLRKELDVLIITRVWQFSDENGMSAQ
jgi:protein TonB